MPTLRTFVKGFSIWLWWLIACIVGIFIGLTLTFLLFTLTKSTLSDLSPHLFTNFAFPFVGLMLGFSQWVLLRRNLPRVRSWILANALSYALSVILWIRLDPIFETMGAYRDYIGFPVVGIASLLLWLVIRRRFSRSLGWALISGIGLVTFFYSIRIVGPDLGQSSGRYIIGDFLTFAFSNGIPSGVVSGILLVFLLGPILSQESYLVEGLTRLSDVSRFSSRLGTEVDDASPPESSFVKFILVNVGLPLLTIGLLVLILLIAGSSYP